MKKSLFILLASPALLIASPAASSPSGHEITLWEMLIEAGWVMIPLYAASFIAMVLILFYFMTLNRNRIVTDEFRTALEGFIREKNFTGLYEASRSSPLLIGRVMEASSNFLKNNPEADIDSIREIAQAEGNRRAAALTQQVIYLMDIGVLAPMLGLMGTVVGILRSFGSIAASEATPMRTLLLAGGVSQALVATAAGLLVGITSMFFYAYFRGRVQGLISELESASTALIAQLGIKLRS